MWMVVSAGASIRPPMVLDPDVGVLEGNRDRFDVGARSTGQVGDERAGIDRDQERSSRSARRSTENLTRPRSARSFW